MKNAGAPGILLASILSMGLAGGSMKRKCFVVIATMIGQTKGNNLMNKEKQSREAVITFLMRQTGLSRKATLASINELESFGLISFNAAGDFRLRKV